MARRVSNGKTSLILTCEHAGNRVPKALQTLFEGKNHILETHRGYDLGALSLAKSLADAFNAPLYSSIYTRLICDLNRSCHNPMLFSEFTRSLSLRDRNQILKTYYFPHREAVETAIQQSLNRNQHVLHVGVHTFTPNLDGKKRRTDAGLLYDPGRSFEKEFCLRWQQTLAQVDDTLQVRRNYPYQGRSDGFPNHFRRMYPETAYTGIELEVNQKFYLLGRAEWNRVKKVFAESLRFALQQRLI